MGRMRQGIPLRGSTHGTADPQGTASFLTASSCRPVKWVAEDFGNLTAVAVPNEIVITDRSIEGDDQGGVPSPEPPN